MATPADTVLVGGGHAHVRVLAAFGKWHDPNVRVTLIARDLMTPYSGMLPGVIAGLYTPEQAHIDLVTRAAATGARLIHAAANGLDRADKQVLCDGHPPVPYDLVSLDVGSTPSLDQISGAREYGIAVKPIGEFLGKFDALRAECAKPDGPRRIAVVGGGAGGVELLLSVRTRLREEAARDGRDPDTFSFQLVTDGEMLATHNTRVRKAFRRVFARRGVTLLENHRVAALRRGIIDLEDGHSLQADATFIVTQAAAPNWFASTGLQRDEGGFIAVGATLQSLNDRCVLAAGDCAALVETPREKAGVYAVREGPPLAANLRYLAHGENPRAFRPQSRHLALISTGERYAIASRGPIKLEGAWLWTLKDWIDRRWMEQYHALHAPDAAWHA
jgi:selenide,water dikinase